MEEAMTYGEFIEGVSRAVAVGDLKPIWLSLVIRPEVRELISAALRN